MKSLIYAKEGRGNSPHVPIFPPPSQFCKPAIPNQETPSMEGGQTEKPARSSKTALDQRQPYYHKGGLLGVSANSRTGKDTETTSPRPLFPEAGVLASLVESEFYSGKPEKTFIARVRKHFPKGQAPRPSEIRKVLGEVQARLDEEDREEVRRLLNEK